MTQKHTPEPWRLYRNNQSVGDAVGNAVCDVWPRCDDQLASEEGKANARRIVACVNACAGLPTEQLESSPLGGVLNGVAGLIAQRDELLAALEAFTSAQDAKRSASGNGAGPIAAAIGNLVIAEERARAAIKKITGATK